MLRDNGCLAIAVHETFCEISRVLEDGDFHSRMLRSDQVQLLREDADFPGPKAREDRNKSDAVFLL